MSSSSCCSYSASSAIHFSSSSSAAFSRTQVSYRILTWLPVWQFYIANASLLVCPSTPRSSLVPVVCIVPCTVQCNCKFALCKLHCELVVVVFVAVGCFGLNQDRRTNWQMVGTPNTAAWIHSYTAKQCNNTNGKGDGSNNKMQISFGSELCASCSLSENMYYGGGLVQEWSRTKMLMALSPRWMAVHSSDDGRTTPSASESI